MAKSFYVTVKDPVLGELVYQTESLEAVGVLTVLFNQGEVRKTTHTTGSIKVVPEEAEMTQILEAGEKWRETRQVSFPPEREET